MAEFLDNPFAATVMLVAFSAVLIAIGVYVVGKVRADNADGLAPQSVLIENFRQLHSQGDLSDEEYRTIRAMLAERLQDQLNGPASPESSPTPIDPRGSN
jgi:uncharacterized membrane protein